MANRRVTPVEDPLIPCIIHIPESQKRFLDNDLPESKSAFIRRLISEQMGGIDIELIKITEEERQMEMKLIVIKGEKQRILDIIAKQEIEKKEKENKVEGAKARLLVVYQQRDYRIETITPLVFKTYSEMTGLSVDELKAWLAAQPESS